MHFLCGVCCGFIDHPDSSKSTFLSDLWLYDFTACLIDVVAFSYLLFTEKKDSVLCHEGA